MGYPDFHYHWEWLFQSSPEALWPLVSDTNHFNRATHLPRIQDRRGSADLVNARRLLSFTGMGIPVQWEELPFEWVRPQRFGVLRDYSSGPMTQMRVETALQRLPLGGTRIIYDVRAKPRNLLGLIAIPIQIGIMSAREFAAVYRKYDQIASRMQWMSDQQEHVTLAPGGEERLAELSAALIEKGASADLVNRSVGVVRHADDLSISHMRPYALADHWGVPRRPTLETFLWATRLGLVDFQWDVLCPLCRGVKYSARSLTDLTNTLHCEVCHIDFAVNFDQSVELTFRPNSAIRPLDIGDYCIGGPQVTPHIVAQQLLAAGAQRDVSLPLEPGRYRARTLALRSGQFLRVADDGAGAQPNVEVMVEARDDQWTHDEITVSTTPTLHLKNATDAEQLFILEHMAWSDQAVTAAEVTTMQLFRDLFAREALRPDAHISVGRLTVMFTDLRDSTRLYRQVGDAVAFGRVMNHFDVLRAAIAEEDGAVVKTIGDSVMAVFRRPVHALRAIRKAQTILDAPLGGVSPTAGPPSGEAAVPLVLKAGVHHGPCIAVNLNERLDYFGSTVNIASRIQNHSNGRDVIITSEVRNDPEVAQWIAEQRGTIDVEHFEAMLKGLDDHFQLFRLSDKVDGQNAEEMS